MNGYDEDRDELYVLTNTMSSCSISVQSEDYASRSEPIHNKNILEQVDVCRCIDIDVLKKYIRNDIESNIEYYDDLGTPYQISNPKKAEWILHKSIVNSKLVGDGNKCIDIIKDNTYIDVSALTLNGNMTNEKSIIQNFSTGNDLDTLFIDKNGEEAVKNFKDKFKHKYLFLKSTGQVDPHSVDTIYKEESQVERSSLEASNPTHDERTKDDGHIIVKEVFYLIFICYQKNLFLSCFKLNYDNIDNLKFRSFTKLNKSIIVDNFIDDTEGTVKLYKSKKRLELRITRNVQQSTKTIKIY